MERRRFLHSAALPALGLPALTRLESVPRFGSAPDFPFAIAFPPVELSRTDFTLAELDQEEQRVEAGWVMAQMEGVLYEPH